jgi:hypothetical protein
MSLVESRSLKEMWGDAVDFYLKDVLIDVFVKNDIPHQLSKNLTEGVLIKLKSV